MKSVNKIILALDTTDLEEVINITKKIKNKIFTVKIGLEFFNSNGKEGIKKFNKLGINNLMLDLKLKDIPETVYKNKYGNKIIFEEINHDLELIFRYQWRRISGQYSF